MLDKSLSPLEGAIKSHFAATHATVWQEKEPFKVAYLMPFGVMEQHSKNARDAGEMAKTVSRL